ncbi:unnamed protein product [Mytilus coruscus]|uniref:Uncharacterized protein n=1 Tax=Mytilus coruscus TaxID=42192 RepID=A0A6J8CGF9_MYTCO|nr:unnamed protein product [Mytilus coruscus]
MYYSTQVFDGEFTGRVVINTTNSEGFSDRFTKKHAGYIFQRRNPYTDHGKPKRLLNGGVIEEVINGIIH